MIGVTINDAFFTSLVCGQADSVTHKRERERERERERGDEGEGRGRLNLECSIWRCPSVRAHSVVGHGRWVNSCGGE